MVVVHTFKFKPGCLPEAAKRFLAGGGKEPEGVKLLARWHYIDNSGGVSVFEADDPTALAKGAAIWSDLLDIESHLVISDEQLGPILAQRYGA